MSDDIISAPGAPFSIREPKLRLSITSENLVVASISAGGDTFFDWPRLKKLAEATELSPQVHTQMAKMLVAAFKAGQDQRRPHVTSHMRERLREIDRCELTREMVGAAAVYRSVGPNARDRWTPDMVKRLEQANLIEWQDTSAKNLQRAYVKAWARPYLKFNTRPTFPGKSAW